MADYVKEELYFSENKTVVDYILGREEQYKMTERQERILENERKEAVKEATMNIAERLFKNGVNADVISKSLNLSDKDINRIAKNIR